MSNSPEIVDHYFLESTIPHHPLNVLNVVKQILETEQAKAHPLEILAELPAIISHWVHSPELPPIGIDRETVSRWQKALKTVSGSIKQAANREKILDHLFDYSGIPFPPPYSPRFSFIDLFAGIGGFRQALQSLGGKCLFSSEWDDKAKETYQANYGEVPFGDIKKFTDSSSPVTPFFNAIPKHDILTGGFPCQAFSQAGKQLGFNEARGTLFFEILKIIEATRPQAIILENVKRLKTHDHGRTFQIIKNSLRNLDYKVYAKVLKATDFGLPQNRERIFIVAFARPIKFEFPKPIRGDSKLCLAQILEPKPDEWYTISDNMYQGHLRRRASHQQRGNGFGFSVFKPDAPYVNTISARYWKDGSEILVEQANKNPRMLTPRECARLQGFPDHFIIHPSRRYAYQQFGNSVPIPVVKAVAEMVLKALDDDREVDYILDPYDPVVF
ncbi:MAG: DNA cytosine methyltransferase [Gemmataceae bacterium]|nr:DNA cytosine methyltransferase [Gemmataceae bacterium]